jgi:hypothetical protein
MTNLMIISLLSRRNVGFDNPLQNMALNESILRCEAPMVISKSSSNYSEAATSGSLLSITLET